MNFIKFLSFFVAIFLIDHGICVENYDINKVNRHHMAKIKHILTTDTKMALGNGGLPTCDLSSVNVSMQCMAACTKIFNISNLDPVALFSSPGAKALDSFGKPPSRIFLGNVNWAGAYDECSNIEGMKYCSNTMTIEVIPGRYATCFPKVCSNTEVGAILAKCLNPVLSVAKIYMKQDVLCDEPIKLSHGNKAAITICALLLFLCLLGTAVDILFEIATSLKKKPVQYNDQLNAEIVTFDKDESLEKSPTVQVDSIRQSTSSKDKGLIYDLVTSFSLIRNTRAVFSTNTPRGAIESINGIRTISMTWVIIGHVYFFPTILHSFDNALPASDILHRFSFMAIGNAFVSVDTFFLLSGLLVTYLTFRRFDANKGRLSSLVGKILLSNIHRYIRLTPSLVFVMLFFTYLFPIILTGPAAPTMQQTDGLTKPCIDYWWTNIIYINNFYPKSMGKQCIGWVWYLANDMQFYLFSPVILVPMFILDQKFANSRLRYVIPLCYLGSWLVLFLIITGVIIGVYDLPTLQMAAGFPGNPRAKNGGKFGDYVYEKPYTRISAYLVGIGLGYILSRKIRMSQTLKPMIVLMGWVIAIVIGLCVVYGPWKVFKKEGYSFLNDAENVTYGTLCRFVWAMAVSWVIYACHHRVGWLVESFLSWKFWIPLSRLTYGAYLLHPIVLFYFYLVNENVNHYQDNIYVFNIISMVVVSYASSFILAVGLEFPVLNIEKRLLKW